LGFDYRNGVLPPPSAAAAYPRRLADLIRLLLDSGFFGSALPPVQSLVVKMRVPKTVLDDALALLQQDGHVEVRATHYHRIYPASRPIRPRIGILTERNIFAHYFEVYQDYLLGVADVAEAAGYEAVFHSELTTTEAKLVAIDECVHMDVKGIAFLGRCESEVRASLLARQLPAVVCGNAMIEQRDFAVVCSDNIFGTKNLIQYLLGLGHRRIAYYATTARRHDGNHHRILGYRDAMAEAGLPPQEDMVFDEPHSGSSAHAAVKIFTGLKNRPTVIACVTDREAFELISELQKSGIKVPQDVSVVGFENSVLNIFSDPALTTVEIYAREMGRIAGKFLLDEVAGPRLPARIILPSLLIERSSVLPLAKTSK